jgi:hypothetical protein
MRVFWVKNKSYPCIYSPNSKKFYFLKQKIFWITAFLSFFKKRRKIKFSLKRNIWNQVWWHTPVVPVLGR